MWWYNLFSLIDEEKDKCCIYGGEWKFAFSVMSGAVVDAVLNLVLIACMGATGAAFGTLFAELTQFCVQLYFTRNHIRGAFSRKSTIQVLIGTCTGVAGCALVMPFFEADYHSMRVLWALCDCISHRSVRNFHRVD